MSILVCLDINGTIAMRENYDEACMRIHGHLDSRNGNNRSGRSGRNNRRNNNRNSRNDNSRNDSSRNDNSRNDSSRNNNSRNARNAHKQIERKTILRPHIDEFVAFLFEHFAVGVWSSGKRHNMDPIIKAIFKENYDKLALTYYRDECDAAPTPEKPWGTSKDISKITGYDKIIMIDDTAEKIMNLNNNVHYEIETFKGDSNDVALQKALNFLCWYLPQQIKSGVRSDITTMTADDLIIKLDEMDKELEQLCMTNCTQC